MRKLPPAEESWPWLDLMFGGGVSLAASRRCGSQRRRMLALELTQMAQRVASVDAAIADPGERSGQRSRAAARNRYLEAALDEGNPSKPLRAVLETLLARPGAAPKGAGAPLRPRRSSASRARCRRPSRRLRIYALDPSVAKRLDSVSVHEATLTVPWDDQPATAEPLRPGPVGEYLEVVDIDPASNRVYDPVDLNDKMLLAQDGCRPRKAIRSFTSRWSMPSR